MDKEIEDFLYGDGEENWNLYGFLLTYGWSPAEINWLCKHIKKQVKQWISKAK